MNGRKSQCTDGLTPHRSPKSPVRNLNYEQLRSKNLPASAEQFFSESPGTGDGMGPTLLIGDCGGFIVTQKMVGRGLHVFGGNWRIDNIAADRICFTDNTTSSHPAAGEYRRICPRPVMAGTSGRLGIDLWCATMFAGAEDKRFIQKSTIV
jgi:hypothetical protein